MKTTGPKLKYGMLFSLALISVLFFCAFLSAAEPDWWGPVKDTSQTVQDNRAAATVGQLKNIAKRAMVVFDSRNYGAGDDIHALISSWGGDSSANNYNALTAGQLKFVGKKFYDRLIALGFHSPASYPWTTSPENNAVVNVGQVKNVFSFHIGPQPPTVTGSGSGTGGNTTTSTSLNSSLDTDGDGMPDAWERAMFGNLSRDGTLDFDGDGISDLDEYALGLNPRVKELGLSEGGAIQTQAIHYNELGYLLSVGNEQWSYSYDQEGNVTFKK